MASFLGKVYLNHIVHTEYINFMNKTNKLSILNMQREEYIYFKIIYYIYNFFEQKGNKMNEATFVLAQVK
jgi:hypothetical protein